MQLTMHCPHCKAFLEDFLQSDLDQKIQLKPHVRCHAVHRVLPEYIDWTLRTSQRVTHDNYTSAWKTASRIARRGRPKHEYEFLLHTATYNFLKFSETWFRQEIDYMKPLLMEAGVIKRCVDYSDILDKYLGYMLIRSMTALYAIHEDHMKPKGLCTLVEIPTVPPVEQEEERVTLVDRDDDYQREILEEVDLSDLYT